MWRTQINPERKNHSIDHRSKVFLMGSCFSTNIGKRLRDAGFQSFENPFGILFNPKSIAANLGRLLEGTQYISTDLIEYDGLYHSLDHHGSYSGADSAKTLEFINTALLEGQKQLLECDYLFITLGSAWAYIHNKTDKAVANCHRIPQKEFDKKLIPHDEICSDLGEVLASIQKVNPKVQVVLTVSPVRHWKDGPIQNQVSKSHLTIATSELCEKIGSCDYFPAYELVMDDLRDYRFYEQDMLHPNELAVDYLWNFFGQTYFNEKTISLSKAIEKKSRILGHKFSNPEEGLIQKQKVKEEISALIDASFV
jgi:hypothetical protein